MSDSDQRWGTELVRDTVRGFPCLVYRERPTSLVTILDGSLRWGEREFLVDDTRRITYLAHHRAVLRVAAHLASLGVEPGDRVMLLAANSVEWIVGFWGVLRLGALVVLGNSWWSPAEVDHAIRTVDASWVLADERRAMSVERHERVLSIASFASLIDSEGPDHGDVAPRPIAGEDDPAIVLFTSGTTGASKGAVLSHRSAIANQHNFLAATRRLPSQIDDDHQAAKSLLSTPLFHTGGVQAILTALLTGGTLVFSTGRFAADRVLELLERERISSWAGVPTMVQRVLDHPDLAKRDLSSLRGLGLGGAPLSEAVVRRATAAFPSATFGISTNYGLTEAGGIVASGSGKHVATHPGTSGRPLPGIEVQIDSQPGATSGEILVRSAALMSGYWGESDSPIGDDGWLSTGDIGLLDEDRFLYVVDRVKDIVIRGGENIASANVERVLLDHPAVAEVAVFGLPHADLGEEVAAVVVPRAGLSASADELVEFARQHLASFEVPSRWWLRETSLPLSVTNKADKRGLRREWLDGETVG